MLTENKRVSVTDSNNGKIDTGTIIKVWPQYTTDPNENWCFTIKLDAPWSGNQDVDVREIGRTQKQISAL